MLLFHIWRLSKMTNMLHGRARTLLNKRYFKKTRMQCILTRRWISQLLPEALPQTAGSCHTSSLLIICLIFFYPCVTDPMDFLGAALVRRVFARYQRVLILGALKWFIMARGPSGPMAAPAVVTLNCSLDCLLYADSGDSVTAAPAPTWLGTLRAADVTVPGASPCPPLEWFFSDCLTDQLPGSNSVELEQP